MLTHTYIYENSTFCKPKNNFNRRVAFIYIIAILFNSLMEDSWILMSSAFNPL